MNSLDMLVGDFAAADDRDLKGSRVDPPSLGFGATSS